MSTQQHLRNVVRFRPQPVPVLDPAWTDPDAMDWRDFAPVRKPYTLAEEKR